MANSRPHPSSYRDPAGFLFYQNEILYRQVAKSFAAAFDQFHQQGLSQHLIESGLLTPYELVGENLTGSQDWHCTLKPERLPFISYPYEWCFGMLKDGALATLQLASEAMPYGMILKDASAYNLQWHKGRMQLIDTLSFEAYDKQKPWVAYRQFCEHFLALLALMHYLQTPLQSLQLAHPDGIPLSTAKKFLPAKSQWNLHVHLHLHLQAKLAAKILDERSKSVLFSKNKMQQMLKSLRETVTHFSLETHSGVWSAYYEEAAQRQDYLQQKKEIVGDWLAKLALQTALDAGANTGEFSLLLAQKGVYTVSVDSDHDAIGELYKTIKHRGIHNIHPLLVDLSNPSPALGVNNEERPSFLARTSVDLVLALALVHHLCIGKNIDFFKTAKLFSSLGKWLLVEFVPKEDKKIKFMLQQKPDVYQWYTKEAFLDAYKQLFTIIAEKEIGDSGRTLYLMKTL